jgi:hypothetical protein
MFTTVNIADNAVAALPVCCREDWKMDERAALTPVVLVLMFCTDTPQFVHNAQVVISG